MIAFIRLIIMLACIVSMWMGNILAMKVLITMIWILLEITMAMIQMLWSNDERD